MKKNLVKRIRPVPLWVWVMGMIAGGAGSVGISRADIQPFYVEVFSEEGKEKQSIHIGKGAKEWTEGRRERGLVADGGGERFCKDLRLFRIETDSPQRLNSAYFYDEGVSIEDASESVAGRVYGALSKKDSEWVHGIYQLGQTPPESMALRLGVPVPKVSEWNRINVTFRNGDGAPISGYSNAREILSMVSVYSYFHQIQDYDSFRSYGDKLWNSSHSYRVSMSDVYYCEGECKYTEKDVGDEVLAEESALKSLGEEGRTQGDSLSEGTVGTDERGTAGFNESPGSSGAAYESLGNEGSAGTGEREAFRDGGPTGKAAMAQNSGAADETEESQTNDVSQTLGYEEGQAGSDMEESSAPGEDGNLEGIEAGQEGEGTQEGAVPQAENAGQATPVNAARAVSREKKKSRACEGHVDLNISVGIVGLKENKNLYALDSQGNKTESEYGDWNGWDETARAYVETIVGQDWYGQYGLASSVSMYVRNPLSASEVEAYLNMLPPETSPIRREIVKQALMSVGCIPYYWGGKPSGGGFEKNGFGTVVPADEDGRVLRGLDCSGWINWVYWTVLGSRLPYESTAGLVSCGRGISKEELQAGDILIRGGEERHVYMFLAWAEGGSMYLIHETTGTVNNVTINTYDLDLPYYRSLVEE